ncbi:hypothetical protein N5D48_15340 [Pseudomonas sp. GD03858]|uniref:RHS repeat-associated core domain-containing protein n=1 Tax=unclassified Pseudomonas TaxID=196821 RepID=UPI00244B0CA6|nr:MULTISPECIES: RHS repeat-associated core domain-containing protein [unclassified Pseudomonas]MDH0646882.1 hypothetical protein [Pseudomonas sp. GD03867]MDH0663784.1 hypothetical protein [Pseudomonas sp. GD03858]
MPVSHYDTAGRVQQDSMGLSGALLSSTRWLLADGNDADWSGEDESAWEALLAPCPFATLSTADATGAALERTDARGHKRRNRHDVAGRLQQSWMTLGASMERLVLRSVTYSAEGQKQCEEQGNGVVISYTYEPRTQRLLDISTERPRGHRSGAKLLQDLRYDYDPVGNVLSVRNDAQATRFWHNRKVVPENHYLYDSLYQLVAASGREMAGIARQGQHPPSPTIPLPINDGAYTNYTRGYHYDRGGNLTCITHRSPAPDTGYTIDMTLSERSNRAVSRALSEDPATVDSYFFASGGQRYLQPGQPLLWTRRDELGQVVQVARGTAAADRETYRYDAASQRIEKFSQRCSSTAAQYQRTLYLPLLELQSWRSADALTQALHVVLHDDAGGAQVRGLHWEHGMPDGLSNDAVRYSHGDLIASAGLELDDDGQVITQEEYYPFGGTSVWAARSQVEARYKMVRYAGKERDATGLYYYGYRYYQPTLGRWLSADPAGAADGLNLYRMVHNNPTTLTDVAGLCSTEQGKGNERASTLSREELYHTYVALKAAPKIIDDARRHVNQFVDSKSQTIAYSAFSMIIMEPVSASYSALGAAAGSALGPAGSLVGGIVAKELAKSIAPPFKPVPSTSLDKQIEKKRLGFVASALESAKHYADPQVILEKAIDKGVNQGLNKALDAAANVTLPISLPVTAIPKGIKEFQAAKNLTKAELVQQFLAGVEKAEVIVEGYISLIEDAFERDGVAMSENNFWVDPLNIKPVDHRGLAIDTHLGREPVIREPNFERHRDNARRAVADAKAVGPRFEQRKK